MQETTVHVYRDAESGPELDRLGLLDEIDECPGCGCTPHKAAPYHPQEPCAYHYGVLTDA